MTMASDREILHRQIDFLPDDVVEQILEFTVYLMLRRCVLPDQSDQGHSQRPDRAVDQFFRERMR